MENILNIWIISDKWISFLLDFLSFKFSMMVKMHLHIKIFSISKKENSILKNSLITLFRIKILNKCLSLPSKILIWLKKLYQIYWRENLINQSLWFKGLKSWWKMKYLCYCGTVFQVFLKYHFSWQITEFISFNQ